ncbi:FAD-dependent monooxygenase [Taklimakanibacter deserti]|uniref:FAD-dependent monooxygenase n=1 Tax=Taklimakanibacter deserti TaxID=2267839 RepID=UPI000E64C7B2
MNALNTQVLIVGAGPTGLTLGLWLKRLGVDIRIIDKGSGPGDTSRALAVQARTLEFHRQIGIVQDVLSAGVKIKQLTMRRPKGIAAEIALSEFGAGVTRYSFAFALPQDIHERVLLGHLQEAGVTVERHTELVDFEDDGQGITAKLRKEDVTSFARVDYLVGCDGARSAVRHGMKLGFPGGTYEQSFYVADVKGHGNITHEGIDIVLGDYGFALIMPVRQSGSIRLIGVVPKRVEAEPNLTFEMIRADVERESGVKVETLNWFSSYRVHHRVADHFRSGRAFIAGDAGHIHSPAGGQGMNTGMGDAVNLAWKLAAVLQGRAKPELLDSYEPERIAFAHSLIKGTDQAFRLVSGRSWLSDVWRRFVMPNILARLLQTKLGSRFFFGLISQTRINYRGSALSQGKAGKVEGGDRLPWVDHEQGDNFAALSSLDWQVHVYGEAQPALAANVAKAGLALHRFEWTAAAGKAGLVRDAAYLVRPDGHVGLVTETQDAQAFASYVARLGIKPRHVNGGSGKQSLSSAA